MSTVRGPEASGGGSRLGGNTRTSTVGVGGRSPRLTASPDSDRDGSLQGIREARGVGPQSHRTSVLIRRESGHTHSQGADQVGTGGGHGVSSPGEASGGTSLGHLDLRSSLLHWGLKVTDLQGARGEGRVSPSLGAGGQAGRGSLEHADCVAAGSQAALAAASSTSSPRFSNSFLLQLQTHSHLQPQNLLVHQSDCTPPSLKTRQLCTFIFI